MSYVLYEVAPSRSLRVTWTMAELGLDYESRDGMAAQESGELARLHPLARLPVLVDDGRTLIESAAICTWLADSHADAGLVPAAGTWARAQHDQWVSFALTEIEAYLWHSFRNTHRLPEAERVPAVLPQNQQQAGQGAAALDRLMGDLPEGGPWLLGPRFQVTDIIVGFTVNWAVRAGAADGLDRLGAYRARLLARDGCPYIE